MTLLLPLPRSELALFLACSALACGALACGAPSPPSFPTTDRWEDNRRQPDGVAIDPLPAPLTPQTQTEASGARAAVLRPPLSPEGAIQQVSRLLDRITAEDQASFASFLTPQALWRNPLTQGSAPLLPHLRERVRRLDYLVLQGVPLVHEPTTEVYTLSELGLYLPGRPARPAEMQQGDLLLRFRVLTPRVGAERLFGDELILLLRPEAGGYRLLTWQEEFQLP